MTKIRKKLDAKNIKHKQSVLNFMNFSYLCEIYIKISKMHNFCEKYTKKGMGLKINTTQKLHKNV